MRTTLTNRLVLPSLLCLLMTGAAAAETRYVTNAIALKRGDLEELRTTVYATNTSETDTIDVDVVFVNQATNGANPAHEYPTQPLSPGETAEWSTPDPYKIGFFRIDSVDDLLIKAMTSLAPRPLAKIDVSTLLDIQEANVIRAADAFAADTKAVLDLRWGVTQIHVQGLNAGSTTCTADVFDNLGAPVGSGLGLTVPSMGMKRYRSVIDLIKTLSTSVSRVEIVCDNAFYPEAYLWVSSERDFSIISPEREPNPPGPPTVDYGPYDIFVPTNNNPQKRYEFRPPNGKYERFVVKWSIVFKGWSPQGGRTDKIHGLMYLIFKDYRAGAMGSLIARGPNKNFIRDVWGFGMKHADKFRFQKAFDPSKVFVDGQKYDFCYDFDFVTGLITITIFDNLTGGQIWKKTSPPSQSPDLGGSIQVTANNNLFYIRLGDSGHENNKSKSIGWKYKLEKFSLYPVAP